MSGVDPMVSAGIRHDRYAETGHLPDNQVAVIAGTTARVAHAAALTVPW